MPSPVYDIFLGKIKAREDAISGSFDTTVIDQLSANQIVISGDIIFLSGVIDSISGIVGPLSAGNYIQGVGVAEDLIILDNNIFTVSGDVSIISGDLITVSGDVIEISAIVGPLSAGNYIQGVGVAEDLIILDNNLATVSGDVLEISGNLSGLLLGQSLSATLLIGNETNGTNIVVSNGDILFGENNLVLDSASDMTVIETSAVVSGSLQVVGDLSVEGTTTTINSENLTIEDNIITLNNNEVGAGITLGSAGIEIERGTSPNVQLRFLELNDRWQVTENGTTFYDILHDGNFLPISAIISGNTVNINTISGDLIAVSAIVGPLSAGNYIQGVGVAEDLVILDNNLLTLSGLVLSGGTYIIDRDLDTSVTVEQPNGVDTDNIVFITSGIEVARMTEDQTTALAGNTIVSGQMAVNGNGIFRFQPS